MNCHICASFGVVRLAASSCQECGAGVCQEHLEEAIVDNRPYRLHLQSCIYGLADPDRTEAPTAGRVQTIVELARLVQRDSVERMWELDSTSDDSPPDYLTILEATAWVSVFPGGAARTPLQVLQRSVRALWDASPPSPDPGSLRELLRGANDAIQGLSSLDVDPGQKPRDAAGLAQTATHLFFARGRARADGQYPIVERITELLSALSAARNR